MNFEKALEFLRMGKRIFHPYLKQDEYFMLCYEGFKKYNDDLEIIGIDESTKYTSLVLMDSLFASPRWTMNLFQRSIPASMIMSEDWLVLGEEEVHSISESEILYGQIIYNNGYRQGYSDGYKDGKSQEKVL